LPPDHGDTPNNATTAPEITRFTGVKLRNSSNVGTPAKTGHSKGVCGGPNPDDPGKRMVSDFRAIAKPSVSVYAPK